MFKNLSLNSKILAGFLVVCFGVAIVAGTGYYGLKQVVKTYDNLATTSVPNMGHISGMRARGRQIHAESIKLALYWDKPEETKKTLESLAHALKRYEGISAEKLEAPFAPGEEEIYRDIEKKFAPIKTSVEQVLAEFNSENPDKVERMKTILLQFEDYVRDHQKALLALDDFHVELGEKWSKESQELSKKMIFILSAVALVTFGLGVLIAFLLSKSIKTILTDVAGRLQESSEKVSNNSLMVRNASLSLASGTTQQAESLHETVASTNQIAAMTEKSADNCRESLKRAELSREASTNGQRSIKQMMDAITEISQSNNAINSQVKRGNEEIQEIVQLILKIGEKTKLIDDIVFQTKLLSFNVSVEAARAGEHGKGFLVVAEEMTNLAGMSGKASKEITTMLNETTQKAMSVVEGNQKNVNQLLAVGEEKIQTGHKVAKGCQGALEEILNYVDEMCSMIKETSMSADEQTKGISEINKAMGQLDSVTAQNASSSQQCSDAADYLMTEVDRTREVAADLHDVIHGKGPQRVA